MKKENSSESSLSDRIGKDVGYIVKACEYIEENYMNDLSVADIAAYVAIDRTYLYRLFCREKGLSPSKYLQYVRLEASRAMMDEKKYTLSDIPGRAGFRNRSRFAEMFKKMYGVSPKVYYDEK